MKEYTLNDPHFALPDVFAGLSSSPLRKSCRNTVGRAAIFIWDDGLQLISEQDRKKYVPFHYPDRNFVWAARPGHDGKEGRAQTYWQGDRTPVYRHNILCTARLL
ncbi:hypothetical protein H0H81_008096 [Sphagnurus paluster]|uniref:Uncharacterized protein n=1 Tax=Sphagnurus paluster TaxID=117069 RepID=A0A9P7GKS5_9AGAR|nr:hypothetical protein H0H81_008096 [Sphagnurus paluster]